VLIRRNREPSADVPGGPEGPRTASVGLDRDPGDALEIEDLRIVRGSPAAD